MKSSIHHDRVMITMVKLSSHHDRVMMTQWCLNNDEEGNVGIDDKNDSDDDNRGGAKRNSR